MGSMFQNGPAMGNLFNAGPQFLGQVRMAGDDSRPPFWGKDRDETRLYCDPAVDPLCERPYEGPIPVALEGNNRSYYAGPSERESAPNLNCNVEWDPGCPRPKPNQTMVPYVPSSYLRGTESLTIGGVEYTQPALGQTARRQRKG